MVLQRVTKQEMADILKNFNQMERDNETRIRTIKVNLEVFRKRAELISQEEAILSEAMSSPGMDTGGVTGSGYVQDNMLALLDRSKELYTNVFQSLIHEQDDLFNQQLMFTTIRQCILELPVTSQSYITEYYMDGKTVEELVDEFQKSVRTVYSRLRDALTLLTDKYNGKVSDPLFESIAR